MPTSLTFGNQQKVRLQFCRNLKRHVTRVYESANQEAQTLFESAGRIWNDARKMRSVRRLQCIRELSASTPPAVTWDQDDFDPDLLWDYLNRAQDAAEVAAFYYQAYLYVRNLKPNQIDLEHSDINGIALGYLSHWKMQRLIEMRSTAIALGWALTVKPLENAVPADDASDDGYDEAFSNAMQYDDTDEDDDYDEWDTEEDEDDEVDERQGLYAVYSVTPTLTLNNAEMSGNGDEDDSEDLNELDDVPAPEDLAELIEYSPHHHIVAPIAREFIEMADLIGEVELRRTRKALYDTISFFHERSRIDAEEFRQEIKALLEESPAELEYRFPPSFHKRTPGYARFLQGLLDYEGVNTEPETLDIADAV